MGEASLSQQQQDDIILEFVRSISESVSIYLMAPKQHVPPPEVNAVESTCIHCNKKFLGLRKRFLCSDACGTARRKIFGRKKDKLLTLTCTRCGKVFTSKRARILCTDTCSFEAVCRNSRHHPKVGVIESRIQGAIAFLTIHTNGGPEETVVTTVDADMNDEFSKLLLFATWSKILKRYYVMISSKDKTVEFKTALHRHIIGASKGHIVDHINGNSLDNTSENLRLCTVAQNVRNRTKLDQRNTSGITGVRQDPWHPERWYCYVNINKKQTTFGPFSSRDEAARERRKLELQHYGEFAPVTQIRKTAKKAS